MSVEETRSKLALSKGFITKQDLYLSSVMDARTAKYPTFQRKSGVRLVEGRKLDNSRSLSHGHGGKTFSYFTFESLSLLVCLTVSLGILPLILPPLPPPPLLLLLIPICILALLMVLAFMPSNIWDATYAYV